MDLPLFFGRPPRCASLTGRGTSASLCRMTGELSPASPSAPACGGNTTLHTLICVIESSAFVLACSHGSFRTRLLAWFFPATQAYLDRRTAPIGMTFLLGWVLHGTFCEMGS